MKTCSSCGRENPDEAAHCTECGTDQFNAAATAATPAEAAQTEWVTLTKCRNLVDADVLASQLDAAGIKVFLPDEFVMQTFSLDSNGFGFARVQVAPADFERAQEILSEPSSELPPASTTEPPSAP